MYPPIVEDRTHRYRRCQTIEAMEAAFEGKTVACTVGTDLPGYPFAAHKEARSVEEAKAIEKAMKQEHAARYVWWWLVEDKKVSLDA